MKQHVLTYLRYKHSNSQGDYGCDNCDGFPEFNSVNEIVTHDLSLHFDRALVSMFKNSLIPSHIHELERSDHKQMTRSSLLGKRKSSEELNLCSIDDCTESSFRESEHYSHYSQHFSAGIVAALVKATAAGNSSSHHQNWLKCPTCSVKCVKFEELVLHFGEHHGVIDDLCKALDREKIEKVEICYLLRFLYSKSSSLYIFYRLET